MSSYLKNNVQKSSKTFYISDHPQGNINDDNPVHTAHVIPVTCHRYHMCHVNRDSLTHCSQGYVVQLVEQRTSNPKVVGSNPT